MKCKVCGAEMSDNNKFCPACGADLREINQEAELAAAEPGPEAAEQAEHKAGIFENPAPAPQFFDDDLAPFVTTGQWFLTLLLMVLLPIAAYVLSAIIGNLVDNAVVLTVLPPVASFITFLILVLVWAFGGRTNPSKRNFFRAYLLLMLIMIVVAVVAALVFGSYIAAYYQQMGITDMNQILGAIN